MIQIVVQNVAAEELGNWWPATNEARGGCCKRVQGGGKGWFRSMQFPAGGADGDPETGPRGNCVAFMPCGAWDYEIRKSKGPGVAPCFLICVIGSGCSLFRDLHYNYRAFGAGASQRGPDGWHTRHL